MFFKRKKEKPSHMDQEEQMYTYLQQICHTGQLMDHAFVIPSMNIYIYADVLDYDETFIQVVFQIHHDTLEETIIDPIYGTGCNLHDCMMDACRNFYQHDLFLFMRALHKEAALQVIAKTQEVHSFTCYASKITEHGKREGMLPDTFWSWLEEGIKKRLGNKRMYWVKVYCAKMDGKSEVEVRLNDVRSAELSKLLKSYVEGWNCLDVYHSEKQCFYFYQKDETYIPSIYTKEDIISFSKRAMELLEKCKHEADGRKLRVQIIKLCKDASLGMEIYGFLPELYCKYAFCDIEYGEQLFLIQKGVPTIELYQSQVRSFHYMDEAVRLHLKKDAVSQKTIDRVVSYSANYQAIRKALDDGKELQELYTPGIGYFVREDYILR